MAAKRKAILNLDEIVNERQRAVAYIVRDYLNKLNLTNQELAALANVSPSTISNIFRKETKIMPGPNALKAIAIGLSTSPNGQVDYGAADALYDKLMTAAQYETRAAISPNQDKINRSILTEKDIKELLGQKFSLLPYESMQLLKIPENINVEFYDFRILLKDCDLLSEWNFKFSLKPATPYTPIAPFFSLLYQYGEKPSGKYSIVTFDQKVYDALATYDFLKEKSCYISVIYIKEDGSMEEKYIETKLSHAPLDAVGLSL